MRVAVLIPAVVALSLFTGVRGVAAASSPACHSSVARYDVAVPGHPFGAVLAPDGSTAFVTVNADKPTATSGIAVLTCANGQFTFSHLVPLNPQPVGIVGTHDGSLLVVADDAFVSFLDARAALADRPAFLGYFQDADGDPEDNDAGSVKINLSPDDKFAFVSDENNNTITVIDLAKARAGGYSHSAVVGQIPTANAPVALVFSPDGKYLYTTSEVALKKLNFTAACRPEGAPADAALTRPPGVIAAIDVAKAETDPAHSVIAQIPGGCSPVRMTIAPDGKMLYVANRNSDSVTAYSAASVVAGRADALVATIPVGSGPVAIGISADGRYVLAGNSNRFGAGGPSDGTISVIATSTLKVVGTLASGVFPREFSTGAGSILFLANNRSDTITVFDTTRIPALLNPAPH